MSWCKCKSRKFWLKTRALFKYCDLGRYASGAEVLELILKINVIEFIAWIVYIGSISILNAATGSPLVDFSKDIFWKRICLVSAQTSAQILQIYTLWKGIHLQSTAYLRCYIFLKTVPSVTLFVLGLMLAPDDGSYITIILLRTLNVMRWSILLYGTIMVWKYHRKLGSVLMSQLHEYCSTLRRFSEISKDEINEYDIGIRDCAILVDPPVDYKSFRKHIISPWDVTVDPSCVLGEGQFGEVFKGTVMIDKSKIPIAAKVAKNAEDSDNFQMLLQEMKIIIHVGEHKNVIKFFGVTSDASVKEHFAMIIAFCDNGCLDEFQKANRHTFLDLGESGKGINVDQACVYVNLDGHVSFSTLDLIRFSTEIAEGMNHLASKGVVHCDLASRNVLLTKSLSIKLTDFGMARRLCNYQTYSTGGQQSFLPWRWMSIEAIEDLKFSEKSDVWSYGVTLWEIFTLGGFPYEEIKWSPKIPFQLRNELKLSKPRYSSEPIYEIMKTCWDVSCDCRPSFSELTTIFNEILKMQSPLLKRKLSRIEQ